MLFDGGVPVKIKEAGFVLSIDQASNSAGVSLWCNGVLQDVTVLDGGGPSDPFSRRLQNQVPQLTDFLDRNVTRNTKIQKVLFEGVRARLVLVTVGAFLTCPRLDAKLHAKHTFIESSRWKMWAKNHGATGPFKEIKGTEALKEVGFQSTLWPKFQQDIADSILMYLTWRDLP